MAVSQQWQQQSVKRAIVERHLRPSLPPSVSSHVRQLLQRAWKREPEERPSMAECARALETHVRLVHGDAAAVLADGAPFERARALLTAANNSSAAVSIIGASLGAANNSSALAGPIISASPTTSARRGSTIALQRRSAQSLLDTAPISTDTSPRAPSTSPNLTATSPTPPPSATANPAMQAILPGPLRLRAHSPRSQFAQLVRVIYK